MASDNYKIDFVITWVDGSDPEWRKEKAAYTGTEGRIDIDARDARYRDWDILKYWFRAVESYAPWVNKIYFITCGHVPEWLDLSAPKLIHVKHSDYMPSRYLPTFSSHPIELCMNRIEGLSEHFVYFNDDMYLGRPVDKSLFFRGGKPVHAAHMHSTRPGKIGAIMPHIYLNNTEVINQYFDMKTVLRENREKWFSIKRNGAGAVAENLLCSRYQMFPGFINEHLPVPILKSTMDRIWELEPERCDSVCRHRFRDVRDISQYVFRYWQLASGNFEPVNEKKLGTKFTVKSGTDSVQRICEEITAARTPMFCINDDGLLDSEKEFEEAKTAIGQAFEKTFFQKSRFER